MREDDNIHDREELEIDLLLEAIYRMSGYDFRNYLRSSMRRRIKHRVELDQLGTITALIERVLHQDGYMAKLLEDFSIKVTEMFRDPSFYLAFRKKVVPLLQQTDEIRIWHAGCATGEEVYSIAILLQEEGLIDKTSIYATDISEYAIEMAQVGRFPLKRMQAYTKNYLQAGGNHEFSAYYHSDHAYAYFHPAIKERMTFARHNLATDGSFNEFHVILCRNVLIYFNQDLQSRVHDVLYDSLAPNGFLGLGNKESFISSHKSEFAELDPEERIYQKNM